MSESDFKDITHNGALCNARGEIGLREFEAIVRAEVYIITIIIIIIIIIIEVDQPVAARVRGHRPRRGVYKLYS